MPDETINVIGADKPDDKGAKQKEKEIVADAEKSIEVNRKEEISFSGLKPDTEYEVEQVEHEFPFGTAIDIERVVLQDFILTKKQMLLEKFKGPEHEKEINTWLANNSVDFDKDYREKYISTAKENFNGFVADSAFKWNTMETYGGFTVTDEVVKYLEEHDAIENFRGHCMLWNRRSKLPDSLKNASKEEIKKATIERAVALATRYPQIKEWDVLNEPLKREPRMKGNIDKDEPVFDQTEDADFFVELFRAVKTANPDAKLYVNEYSILSGKKLDDYTTFIKSLVSKGAPIDGIGAQGHMWGWDFATIEQAKSSLDALSKLDIPIKITEFDVTDEAIMKMFFGDGQATQEAVQEKRADYFRNMLTLFYGTPKVNGVFLWGFQDKCHWRGNEGAGLFDTQFKGNKTGKQYIQRVQKDWKTKEKVKTDKDGNIKIRGFKGEYKVTEVTNAEVET